MPIAVNSLQRVEAKATVARRLESADDRIYFAGQKFIVRIEEADDVSGCRGEASARISGLS